MDIMTLLGLVLAFGSLIASVFMEEGKLESLISPSAFLIVFGGTFGATLVSHPQQTVILLPKLLMLAVMGKVETPDHLVEFFVELANKARREGLLSLEEKARELPDPFLRKGIMLVVDGVDPKIVREILHADTVAMTHRHKQGYGMLEAMGGFAPTMGIIGTVMGLINVLSNLTDPSKLGGAIAVAFVATLYGVASANLIWLPIGNKLKKRSEAEVFLHEIMVEGILAVQAGHNPHVVGEHLKAFVAPKVRNKLEQEAGARQATKEAA